MIKHVSFSGRCQCGTPLFRLPPAVVWLGPGWELSLFLSTGTDHGRLVWWSHRNSSHFKRNISFSN